MCICVNAFVPLSFSHFSTTITIGVSVKHITFAKNAVCRLAKSAYTYIKDSSTYKHQKKICVYHASFKQYHRPINLAYAIQNGDGPQTTENYYPQLQIVLHMVYQRECRCENRQNDSAHSTEQQEIFKHKKKN